MKVSIVIPIWNGSDAIKRNLPKILEVARDNKINEVILSDDDSTDDSVDVIQTFTPEVTLIKREDNQGFASNVNTGVNKAKGDLIVLLNIDALPEKDFLKFALPHFRNLKVFSVSCNVGGLWTKGGFKDGYFWHQEASKNDGDVKKAHQTLWASGGSGIFRKKIWDELGGLDILFNPFYVEDVDLGYRATKRGYINIWEPKSKVKHYHEIGAIASNFSTTTINNASERNMLIFIWKNITDQRMILAHKVALFKRLIKHPKYWLIFLSALRFYPEIMEKRRMEKMHAKLNDKEIFGLFKDN